MDAARRVVLLECGLGLLWTVYGFGTQSAATLRAAWWVAACGAVAIPALLYLEEHRWTDWGVYRRGATTIAAVLVSVALAAAAVAVTTLSTGTVVSVGLGGLGIGLLAYRAVYGLVYPVPESRLDRVNGSAF